MRRSRFVLLLAIAFFAVSCNGKVDVLFDTPFVSITGLDGNTSSLSVDKEANNMLVELPVRICASNKYFVEPATVEYETVIGAGLVEGVDFVIQPTTKSPLTFDTGEYTKLIRIIWKKNPAFDPSASDNTLTIRLTACSIKGCVIGYPGPDAVHSSFTFTKQ